MLLHTFGLGGLVAVSISVRPSPLTPPVPRGPQTCKSELGLAFFQKATWRCDKDRDATTGFGCEVPNKGTFVDAEVVRRVRFVPTATGGVSAWEGVRSSRASYMSASLDDLSCKGGSTREMVCERIWWIWCLRSSARLVPGVQIDGVVCVGKESVKACRVPSFAVEALECGSESGNQRFIVRRKFVAVDLSRRGTRGHAQSAYSPHSAALPQQPCHVAECAAHGGREYPCVIPVSFKQAG
ncbi:hypothetical protein B0H11DRAFT_1904286 [Mycena galericulata]|nr:hypothetical protein B0H11DRAFT_1904286 [Mycena galericulata]